MVTMSALVKFAEEIDEPPDIGQPTAECQLIWLPEKNWVEKVEVTSVEEGTSRRTCSDEASDGEVLCKRPTSRRQSRLSFSTASRPGNARWWCLPGESWLQQVRSVVARRRCQLL